jgi:chorismate--pyruvate lyase
MNRHNLLGNAELNRDIEQKSLVYLDTLINLDEIVWQEPALFRFPSAWVSAWLLAEGSLSLSLNAHCQQLSVKLLKNQWLENDRLTGQEASLLPDEACLLRQVILAGDEVDWVLGSTLIPRSSAQDTDYDFTQQGELPLGVTIFRAENVKRDRLQVANIMADGRCLFARRSRLWMDHKPMLVTEIFLPNAPLYMEGRLV